MEKRDFNSPEDYELDAGRESPALETPVAPGILMGNWVNTNPGTRGIVKLSIAVSGASPTAHLYGACTPNPCDWGAVKAITYSPEVASPRATAFTALYTFAFKDVIVAGHLEGQFLVVEVFNRFKDGSRRYDYYGRETFRRA